MAGVARVFGLLNGRDDGSSTDELGDVVAELTGVDQAKARAEGQRVAALAAIREAEEEHAGLDDADLAAALGEGDEAELAARRVSVAARVAVARAEVRRVETLIGKLDERHDEIERCRARLEADAAEREYELAAAGQRESSERFAGALAAAREAGDELHRAREARGRLRDALIAARRTAELDVYAVADDADGDEVDWGPAAGELPDLLRQGPERPHFEWLRAGEEEARGRQQAHEALIRSLLDASDSTIYERHGGDVLAEVHKAREAHNERATREAARTTAETMRRHNANAPQTGVAPSGRFPRGVL